MLNALTFAREGRACSGIFYRKFKNKDPSISSGSTICKFAFNGHWDTKDPFDGTILVVEQALVESNEYENGFS